MVIMKLARSVTKISVQYQCVCVEGRQTYSELGLTIGLKTDIGETYLIMVVHKAVGMPGVNSITNVLLGATCISRSD